MELRPGYKKTEVGVIPEEWEVRPLLTTVRIANGQVDPKTEPYKSFILVAPDHIESATGRLLDKQTAAEQRAISGKYVFGEGDVVYSKIRPYLRKATLAEFGGLCSADMYPLKPANDVSPGFILAVLLGHRFSKYAESVSVRSGMPKINRAELAEYSFALPLPLPEQRAIAATLSDVDALLSKLDQLIAKKRDIKQAAMQQLLTGKKRLPGFSGEWEVKRLGDVGIFRGGSGFPTRYQGNVEGDYPFYKVSDMNNDGNSTFMVSSNNWITENIRKQTGANTFPANTIVFAKIGAALFLERKKLLTQASCIDNNMMGFVLDERVAHHRFVHYLFLSIQLGRLVAATALPSLNGKEIAGLLYGIPTLPEQQTIAAVLSDMDAEIAALEARRDKTRDLKLGMMQELLTGRIRLV